MNCPSCSKKIHWSRITFSAIPVWITCKSCSAKLVGNKLIKIQTIAATILALFLGIGVASMSIDLTYKYLLLTIGIIVIVVPNVILTVIKGKYYVRPS
ncbi:hypothetical protein NUITMVS3_16380 [Shewanella xiamenensis]|nr:hypothetical protein NUITMVS2_35280 [Shewanella xiamenensis]GLD77207.1 hypothetical protein NUITMVS3_16380 [Shewanella xiamenensis]